MPASDCCPRLALKMVANIFCQPSIVFGFLLRWASLNLRKFRESTRLVFLSRRSGTCSEQSQRSRRALLGLRRLFSLRAWHKWHTPGYRCHSKSEQLLSIRISVSRGVSLGILGLPHGPDNL